MKKKQYLLPRYLNSVGKGENALELSSELREIYRKRIRKNLLNLMPTYIKRGNRMDV